MERASDWYPRLAGPSSAAAGPVQSANKNRWMRSKNALAGADDRPPGSMVNLLTINHSLKDEGVEPKRVTASAGAGALWVAATADPPTVAQEFGINDGRQQGFDLGDGEDRPSPACSTQYKPTPDGGRSILPGPGPTDRSTSHRQLALATAGTALDRSGKAQVVRRSLQNQTSAERDGQRLLNLEAKSTENARLRETDQAASSNGRETPRSAGSRPLASARFGTVPEGPAEHERARHGPWAADAEALKAP